MRVSFARGYTFIEVLVALGISVTMIGSLVLVFLTVKSVNVMAKHKAQALQLARAQVENLKATNFGAITSGTSAAAFDAGPDGIYGDADDMQGTLTTVVQDLMDYDNDGNATETLINVDGVGGNESNARPIRVMFSWDEYVMGQTKNMMVAIDTIIAQ